MDYNHENRYDETASTSYNYYNPTATFENLPTPNDYVQKEQKNYTKAFVLNSQPANSHIQSSYYKWQWEVMIQDNELTPTPE